MDAGGGEDGGDRKRVCVRQEGTPLNLNDKETSDVVILLVEDEEERGLHAHKAVLTRHSDYFRSLFSERWNQGKEQSMATIDTSGKGGIAKYEKFFKFIYTEPVRVASLESLHGILDMLEIASELSCEAIVNACDHYLACVHWPEGDLIGVRLMSLCDKVKCSQDLAQRLVEYGHPRYRSTLKQKAVEVWQEKKGHRAFSEAFANFTLMILPIMPEEFVVHTILPALRPASCMKCYKKIFLTIFELSKEFNASNLLVTAKGLMRCLRPVAKFEGVEDKLAQLVSKLGEVEQWDVFVEWATAGELDWPNLRPSWFKFCQQFCHLPAVRDAALKSWHESKNEQLALLTKLLIEMMPEVVARNFGLVSENLCLDQWHLYSDTEKAAQLTFTICTDMLEQVTAGKLLLDTSERFALAKHVMSLMSRTWRRQMDFAITATQSLIKLVKTIPAEKRCELLLEDGGWPSIAEAFRPLQGMNTSFDFQFLFTCGLINCCPK